MLVSTSRDPPPRHAYAHGCYTPLASPSSSLSHLSLAERPQMGLSRRSSSGGTGGSGAGVQRPMPRRSSSSAKGKEREEQGPAAPLEAPRPLEAAPPRQEVDAALDSSSSAEPFPPAFPPSTKGKHVEDPEDARTDAEGHPRFVGNPAIRRDRDEPILRETQDRFVLFPIQYQEVRPLSPPSLASGGRA